MLGAVIRNTANPTMLGAGYKVNVIPTEATAHVDGRFLPGFEDEFFATLAELCGDNVSWEFLSKQQPWETPYDGRLVDAMTQSILAEDPDGIVAPYLMSGGTDAKHFREARDALLRLRTAATAARPRLRVAVPRRRRAGAGGRAGVRRAGVRPLPRAGLSEPFPGVSCTMAALDPPERPKCPRNAERRRVGCDAHLWIRQMSSASRQARLGRCRRIADGSRLPAAVRAGTTSAGGSAKASTGPPGDRRAADAGAGRVVASTCPHRRRPSCPSSGSWSSRSGCRRPGR